MFDNRILDMTIGEALPLVEAWLGNLIESRVKQVLEVQEQNKKPERMLSAKEACEMLGVSLTTLWKLRKEGSIKYSSIGKSVKIAESEIQRYLRDC